MASAVDMLPPQPPPGAEVQSPSPVAKHDELVTKHSYSTGQIPPNPDTTRQGEQSADNANTFATPTQSRTDKPPQATPSQSKADEPSQATQPLPEMFTDPKRAEWAAEGGPNPKPDADIMLKRVILPHVSTVTDKPSKPNEPEEPQEDDNPLGCSEAPEAPDGGQGISQQELEWIVDMCNEKVVPLHRRQAILRAIRNINGTLIHQTLIESFQGCDDMIAQMLNEAELEAATGNTHTALGG